MEYTKGQNSEIISKHVEQRNLRRACTHIRRALPNMFKYIDDPEIPANTNGLKSFFRHLRANLRIHRGLFVEHHENFIW